MLEKTAKLLLVYIFPHNGLMAIAEITFLYNVKQIDLLQLNGLGRVDLFHITQSKIKAGFKLMVPDRKTQELIFARHPYLDNLLQQLQK